MDDVNTFLIEWFIRFLENKDVVRKNIVSIDPNKNGFDLVVNYKDKTVNFILQVNLEITILEKINKNGHFGLIVLNNVENLRFVYLNWKKLAEIMFLRLYFINPFSQKDKVWTLFPHIHDSICDKSSLETGLKSMSEMVEPVMGEEIRQKVKSGKEVSDL